MARIVDEIMNHELFAVSHMAKAQTALANLLTLGISAAPVVEADGTPLGVVALRDVIGRESTTEVFDCMTTPAATVARGATIHEAAERLADGGFHHLIVVDEEGLAVGFVGALDVVRGLVGKPVPHPAAFPHFDASTGLVWTDDTELRLDRVDAAPDGPGLLALIHGGAGRSDAVVWAEASSNVRTRLIAMLSVAHEAPAHVRRWIDDGSLRFRAAAGHSAHALAAASEKLRRQGSASPNPKPTTHGDPR